MATLIRAKLDATYTDYFNYLYKKHGCIPDNHQAAINLRIEFFNKYILQRKPHEYKSPIERDWSYVARREYRYDVTYRSGVDAGAAGLTAMMIRQFQVKKFVMWPFFPVALATYLYRENALFIYYNKKFLDMCNVGEQYELGFARNVVLRKCNKLLDKEDF